jgi:hypothetical protein
MAYIGKNMLNRAVVIATLLAAAAACAHAQWLNYPDPRTPRDKDGKPNLTAPAPRAPDGKPDLSGVWRGEPTPHSDVSRVLGEHFYDLQVDVEFNSKYTFNLLWDLQPEAELLRPEGAAVLKERLTTLRDNCLPGSFPFNMSITPFKIVQTPRELCTFCRSLFTGSHSVPVASCRVSVAGRETRGGCLSGNQSRGKSKVGEVSIKLNGKMRLACFGHFVAGENGRGEAKGVLASAKSELTRSKDGGWVYTQLC